MKGSVVLIYLAATLLAGCSSDATDPSGSEFVPAAERIAVLDYDGTSWTEDSRYEQLVMTTHAGMTTDSFTDLAAAWLDTARDWNTVFPP